MPLLPLLLILILLLSFLRRTLRPHLRHLLHHNALLLFASSALLPPAPLPAAPFDSARAMADIRSQVAFGPRIPGTEGHAKCREWIKAQMQEAGFVVREEKFEVELALIGKTAPAFNLWGIPPAIAENPGSAPPFFALTAHWDTRPLADREPPGAAQEPFLGANDGGSGVAVALGLARAAKGTPLEGRLVLIFFDAEDSGIQGKDATWCLGARHAAKNAPEWYRKGVVLGINLDMVAGREMRLSREPLSARAQPELLARLWRVGLDLAPHIFLDRTGSPMVDDHLPFIQAGMPHIDLIGVPYDGWHRLSDLPEACDPATMESLARVLTGFMRRELVAKQKN